MCTTHDHLINSTQWNWEGDVIIYDPIIPKTRKVTGTQVPYEVDIREFLTSRDNAVIRKSLGEISKQLSDQHRNLFLSRSQGSFDFRANVLCEFMYHTIAYRKGNRNFDAWLFPDETLTLKKGDCEDRAFLLASLMIASGISNYNIRLAFGKIQNSSNGKQYDHVWVMYKNESGLWQLIEPLSHCKTKNTKTESGKKNSGKSQETKFDYIPYFLSNDEHLWAVKHNENRNDFKSYIRDRNFWSGYNPSFESEIHRGIIRNAIDAEEFYKLLTDDMKSELLFFWKLENLTATDYFYSFANRVANVDITLDYDPFAHYDNAFITEGFDQMNANLAKKGSLDGLAKALHAVADFYSHTSYSEFAKKENSGKISLVVNPDPSSPDYAKQFINNSVPEYGSGIFDFTRFSFNENWYKQTETGRAPAINFWNGKIISGRYGQHFDSKKILEGTQFWPHDLKDGKGEREMYGGLPHHNEIAVDEEKINKHHVLYSEKEYEDRYPLRRDAAIRHTTLLFNEWKK
jgi:hypothetical protein